MSLKTPLAIGEHFRLFHENLLGSEDREAVIELTDPAVLKIHKEGPESLTVTVGITAQEMDKIAQAWVHARQLER